MNRPNEHDRDEREWQAQERALQQERLGLAPGRDDPLAAGYRPVVRALREPLPDALPADFARRVAERALRVADRRAAMDLRLERNLMRGLFAALVLGGLFALVVYGGTLWRPLAAGVAASSGPAATWLLPTLACVALTWVLDVVRKAPGQTA
jgi:hypothetical protein